MISSRLFMITIIMVIATWVYVEAQVFDVEFLKKFLMTNPGHNCTSEEAASEAAANCFNPLSSESDQMEMLNCLRIYCGLC